MSTRELHRLERFSRVQGEALRLVDAAEMLTLSYRQTKRLWRRYRLEGASGLQHRSAGRDSRRQRRSPRVKAVLLESEQGAIEVCYGGETMAFTELSGPPPRASQAEPEGTVHVRCSQRPYRPGPESPYKRHAGENIKRLRRRLLAKAVAARRREGCLRSARRRKNRGARLHSSTPPGTTFRSQQRGHFNRGKSGDILKEV